MDKRKILVAGMLTMSAAFLPTTILAEASPSPVPAAQNAVTQITGVVVDQNGEPLIGATVKEQGTSNGASTDIDGRFTLRVRPGAKLFITYVGCEAREVKAEPDMRIVLTENSALLDELVVVGFGVQKKVNLTGSVSVADEKLLSERPVSTVGAALQGVVPGLNIGIASGSLETNPTMNIRGNGTIGDGSSGSPLILIDGFEGDINLVNPQDIESISVLKDAASASIYGSRAPFGVILVTTKKGKEGKAVINYNNSFRFNSLMNKAQTMDSFSFVQFFNDGCMNTSGWGPHFGQDQIDRVIAYQNGTLTSPIPVDPNNPNLWADGYAYGNANVDWYDAIFKTGSFAHEHNLSVSGGTDKINYYVSGNFLGQDGNMRFGEDWANRYTLTGKINAEITKWLTLGFSTRWTRRDYNRPANLTDGLYSNLGRQGWPTLPLYDPNGYLYDSPSPALGLATAGNDRTQTDDNYNSLNFIIKPLKGWDIHAELNYRVYSSTRHWDKYYTYNHDVEGNPVIKDQSSNVHEDYDKANHLTANIYSNYSWTVAEKNDFHVMLGFQAENYKQTKYGAQRDGMLVEGLPELDLTSGTSWSGDEVTPSVNGERNEWSTAGFFGRINYNYDSRYLAEFNLRYDGTSRFRSNRRWIWLPSASIGWNIANEKFWEDFTNVCNNLKLRASYGVLGNQNVNNWYQTYRVLGIGIANGTWLQDGKKPNTVQFPGLVSQLLTWEKVYNWDFGLDWGFFNNRLTGSFDFYIRDTKNMVGPAPELPSILGTDVPKTNNANLRDIGWDLQIAWNDQLANGFSYGARFVLSDSRTKITKYPNNPTGNIYTYNEGRYINEIWGYETIGIAKTQEEMDRHLASLPNGGQDAVGANFAAGDIMYRDLNGDGKISAGASTVNDHGDLKVIGNATPRFRFSLDLTAAWKGFDLRVYLQGVMKRDFFASKDTWNGGSYFWGMSDDLWWSQGLVQHGDYFRDESTWSVQNGYSTANTDSYYPRPVFSGGEKNRKVQTRYLQDASYIRLKNLQIGYTLPQSLTRKASIDKVRIFFSGENLLTGTSLSKLFDPETVDSNFGGCTYPLSRTYSFGISVTL